MPADSLPAGLDLLIQQTPLGSNLLWPQNFQLKNLLPYIHEDFLLINGYSLPMIKFAKDIMEQTLRGVLNALEGYEKNCNIEVIIKEQDK